jgi:hypothetical protein
MFPGELAIALHNRRGRISVGSQAAVESRIKDALVALMDAVKRADGDAVAGQMALLDGYVRQARETLDPQLVHFLERRSYPKALMFLGGAPGIPAGSCGGRP